MYQSDFIFVQTCCEPVLELLLLISGQAIVSFSHHHDAVLLLQAVAADGDATADGHVLDERESGEYLL